MVLRIALIAVIASCTACATSFDKISYFNMAPRLEYQGFSFDRPPNPSWYLLQSEQSYADVTLRRDFGEPSKTHTFYARIGLGGLSAQPTSHEEFAIIADPGAQKVPYEIREGSRRKELITKQGQWCIRYESTNVARGAPSAPDRELVMIVRGFRCLHPAFPRTALDFFYSERGLRDEIDPDLWEEGEEFLRGVRIDVAPDTPAAQPGAAADGAKPGPSGAR